MENTPNSPNIEGFTVIPIGLEDLAVLTAVAAIHDYIDKLDYVNKGFQDLANLLREEPEIRERLCINQESLDHLVRDIYNIRINFVGRVMRMPEEPADHRRLEAFQKLQRERSESLNGLRRCRNEFTVGMQTPRDPGRPGV